MVAGEEGGEVAFGGGRMEGEECVSDVLAGKVEERKFAAGVVVRPF